ncbi:MAG: hypothetical protein RL404_242 [Pseudomonadota bacterium]
MELALYAKDLGYYAGGAAKLGKDGDFTTAPEITPLFGATLARFAQSLLPGRLLRVLEFGAGTGKLAQDILTALRAAGAVVESYEIVELSAELRGRQQALLGSDPVVRWLSTPPPAFSGLVIGNEVLDAMPVHLLVREEGHWRERGVIMAGEGFGFADRDAAPELATQIADVNGLPDGYVTEVHPQQSGFIRMLADMLRAGEGGAALLIDYGFPASEYYLPQRAEGTLMCHYRHHAHADPFFMPGLQDITAHVDFTEMARAGLGAGLEIGTWQSQATFLLAAGLPELLQQLGPDDARVWLPQANAIQKLTSPAEMGELFKVLVLSHRLAMPAAISRSDRSYKL